MTGAPYLPGFGRCGIPRTSTRWSWTWGSVAVEKGAGPARWNPTSAKTGQIWGTRHLLLVKRSRLVCAFRSTLFDQSAQLSQPTEHRGLFAVAGAAQRFGQGADREFGHAVRQEVAD
jgi:hypothetical protein